MDRRNTSRSAPKQKPVIDPPHTAGGRTPLEDGSRAAVLAGYLHGQAGPPEEILRQIPAILRQDTPFPDLARRTRYGQAGQPFRTGRDRLSPAHQFLDRGTGIASAVITTKFSGQTGADHKTAHRHRHHSSAFRRWAMASSRRSAIPALTARFMASSADCTTGTLV